MPRVDDEDTVVSEGPSRTHTWYWSRREACVPPGQCEFRNYIGRHVDIISNKAAVQTGKQKAWQRPVEFHPYEQTTFRCPSEYKQSVNKNLRFRPQFEFEGTSIALVNVNLLGQRCDDRIVQRADVGQRMRVEFACGDSEEEAFICNRNNGIGRVSTQDTF